VNAGKCEEVKFVSPSQDSLPNSEINIFVPPLTKEQYDAIPVKTLETKFETQSRCGNEFHVHEHPTSDVKADICPDNNANSCNNAAVRNTFNGASSGTVKIQWLVFKCADNWWQTATTKIAEANYELNQNFKPVGVQFNSYISFYPCTGSKGDQDYNTIGEDEATSAILLERGSNWRSEGSLMIVAGTPEQSNLGGFFYFPCGNSPCGSGFMNTLVVAKGQSTLTHELGHGFGLYHTFRGVSEVTTCSSCREIVASDTSGDYCQDTPPTEVNFKCVSPLTGITDACDATKTSYTNPFKNFMSYGSCNANEFTSCQLKRMRCFYEKSLKSFLILDTNPVQSTVPATSGGGAGSTSCFGVVSTSSSVCSGRGRCIAKDVCQCDSYWGGSKCDTFNFFGAGNSLESNVIGTLFFMACIFAMFAF
jgi:hypothetical protein